MPTTSLSASVPSGFRFRTPSSPHQRARSFFAPPTHRQNDDTEALAPVVNYAAAKTRLEVLKGWEVNFAVLSLYAAATVAFVYVIFKLDAVASAWNSARIVPELSSVEEVVRETLEAASVLLPIVFVASLLLYRAITDEQIWTLGLLAVGLLATNPLNRRVLSVPNVVSPAADHAGRAGVLGAFNVVVAEAVRTRDGRASLIWNEAVYTAVIYLYLLLAAHSYRVFDVRKIHTVGFYAPKLSVSFGYFFVKVIAGFKADVSLGLVPYARVLTWLTLLRAGRSSLRITLPVLLTTGLDTAFGFWLVREVAVTARFLAKVPYVENRAKQLGFRCFVFQTLVFCFNMIGLSMFITWRLPRSFILASIDDPREHFFELEPPVARLALAFVYFTWTLVLAFVNLPPRPVMPFVRRIGHRFLFMVRHSRAAGWLGWADIVNTVDAEDSSCDGDGAGEQGEEARGSQPTLQASEVAPFRYRHREMFDIIKLSVDDMDFESPLMRSDPECTSRSMLDLELSSSDYAENDVPDHDAPGNGPLPASEVLVQRDVSRTSLGPLDEAASPPLGLGHTHRPYSSAIDIPGTSGGRRPFEREGRRISSLRNKDEDRRPARKKLRMRKNLFVMETQVILANAAYLSYIPGNDREERERPGARTLAFSAHSEPLSAGSLSNHLDDLEGRREDERESFFTQHSTSIQEEMETHPDVDDGSMFMVDPYEMALKHGFRLHKHISDRELNTHAIILVNSTRVIVAFSGTRNVTNWGVNANLNRALLDEKLGRFEYELSCDSDSASSNDTYEDSDAQDPFAIPMRSIFTTRPDDNSQARHGRIRRSRSDERLSLRATVQDFGGESRAERHGAEPRSYGSVTNREKERVLLDSALYGEPENAGTGFVTHHGVSMVASTFARELMTFGQPKVHEGFMTAYLSLRKRVMGALVELYRGTAYQDEEAQSTDDLDEQSNGPAHALPLFLCGHSLGGALATFASYEAARYFKRIGIRNRHDISCTTFGCPRMGNEAFKARYERLVETHWRFEIASDPVPKIPITLLNYMHVGVHVLIDQSGMLLIDPSFIEVQWWGKLTNLYLGYRLHSRASYCMALQNYCKLYKNGTEDLAECFWPFPIRVQTRGLFVHTET